MSAPRYPAPPSTACAACGGPTTPGGRYAPLPGTDPDWRACAACTAAGPLEMPETTTAAAVRARHGDRTAGQLRRYGVRRCLTYTPTGVPIPLFHAAPGCPGPHAEPVQPWEHAAGEIDALAEAVAAVAAGKMPPQPPAAAHAGPCALCGGPTGDGRPMKGPGTGIVWRVCGTCGRLHDRDAMVLSAVRVRHGDDAARLVERGGVLEAEQRAGELPTFKASGGQPTGTPGDPWGHCADAVAALVTAADRLGTARPR